MPSGYGPSGGGRKADIDVGESGPEPFDMLPVRCAKSQRHTSDQGGESERTTPRGFLLKLKRMPPLTSPLSVLPYISERARLAP